MRPIDADKAIEVAQIKYNDWNLAMAAADSQREINLCFKKQELFKAVKAVLGCVPTLTPQNKWVSVEERLPEPTYCVLVYTAEQSIEVDARGGDGEWMSHEVTHWMPLPAPPTEGK